MFDGSLVVTNPTHTKCHVINFRTVVAKGHSRPGIISDLNAVKTLTSELSASRMTPGTGSGQNSSGVKLQSIRFINGRPSEGQTYKRCQHK